jgi:hypothetical protein
VQLVTTITGNVKFLSVLIQRPAAVLTALDERGRRQGTVEAVLSSAVSLVTDDVVAVAADTGCSSDLKGSLIA